MFDNGSVAFYQSTDSTPSWVYNSSYWTMSPRNDSSLEVWYATSNGKIISEGNLIDRYVGNAYNFAVRPVVIMNKSVLD